MAPCYPRASPAGYVPTSPRSPWPRHAAGTGREAAAVGPGRPPGSWGSGRKCPTAASQEGLAATCAQTRGSRPVHADRPCRPGGTPGQQRQGAHRSCRSRAAARHGRSSSACSSSTAEPASTSAGISATKSMVRAGLFQARNCRDKHSGSGSQASRPRGDVCLVPPHCPPHAPLAEADSASAATGVSSSQKAPLSARLWARTMRPAWLQRAHAKGRTQQGRGLAGRGWHGTWPPWDTPTPQAASQDGTSKPALRRLGKPRGRMPSGPASRCRLSRHNWTSSRASTGLWKSSAGTRVNRYW